MHITETSPGKIPTKGSLLIVGVYLNVWLLSLLDWEGGSKSGRCQIDLTSNLRIELKTIWILYVMMIGHQVCSSWGNSLQLTQQLKNTAV